MIEPLIRLGLSRTEATLYVALLKLGEADVQTLVEETGFYKANTYQALERLYEKGIISQIVERGKRFYQLQKPEALLELVQKKKRDLEYQELLTKKLIKQVETAKGSFSSHETAIVLRGVAGVKQIYSEIVTKKLDYISFGAPLESESVIGDFYWQNLHTKQKTLGIKAKMIFQKSLRHWKRLIPFDVVDLKFLDNKLEPLTEVTVYGAKTAFTVWTEKPIVTIIDNEHVANSYRQVFDILWKVAKR